MNHPTQASASSLRLGVFVARATGLSRRKAFEAVMAGRVRVNGRLVFDPSTVVHPDRDEIALDDERLVREQRPVVVLLNKPKGVTCTRWDPHADKTVMELLPDQWHDLFPVGRLDKDSEGLLILTNCGDIAAVLSHPRYEVRKQYRVWLTAQLSIKTIKSLLQGRRVSGERLSFDAVRLVGKDKEGLWMYDVTIHEGRKRHIRRLLSHVGRPVQRLLRMQHGPLRLGDLPSGQSRWLNEQEIKRLRRWCRRRLRDAAADQTAAQASSMRSNAVEQTQSGLKRQHLKRTSKKQDSGTS